MRAALWLSSGNVHLNGPVETVVFLVLMIGLGGWMGFAGWRLRRRAAEAPPTYPNRGLDGMFGIVLMVVGTGLAALSLYLLVGGLAGVAGVEKIAL